jgi:DNA-binding NarL/FixJ family response regulator
MAEDLNSLVKATDSAAIRIRAAARAGFRVSPPACSSRAAKRIVGEHFEANQLRGCFRGPPLRKMKSPITVLIADDHPIFRKGLCEVLSEDQTIKLVAEVGDGLAALQKIRELKPRAAVLDLDMPQMNGLQVAKKVSELKLPVAVVMLTMHKEEMLFNEAMNAGILGFLLKENAANDLLGCIHAVVGGESFISPSLSSFLLNRKNGARKLIDEKPELVELTAAERRILKLITEDLTSKEIAERLGISAHTVENHRAKICERLNLRGSHSLLKFAYDNKSRL